MTHVKYVPVYAVLNHVKSITFVNLIAIQILYYSQLEGWMWQDQMGQANSTYSLDVEPTKMIPMITCEMFNGLHVII